MPNYRKLSKQYQEAAKLALARFVSIDSVYDASTVEKGAPFGAGVKKALDYIAALGTEMGFAVDKCDGYCTELTYGDEGPLIGIYAHADVVPATGDWVTPPFEPSIRGKKMYARGTSDDKGPLIAALYGVKALKDAGLIRGYRVRIVAGGNEESGCQCLEHYFGTLKKPQADYAFTPDSDFPLVYAEKGMLRDAWASKEVDLSPITKMEGGSAPNAVCDSLDVYLPEDKAFIEYLKKNGIDFAEAGEGAEYHINFKGKSAHGSLPGEGVNAALIAFKCLGEHYGISFLSLLHTLLKDWSGKNFGGYQNSPELGSTTYNYGIVSYDGKTLKFSIDHRYGETGEPEKNAKAFEEKTGMKLQTSGITPFLYFKKDSPLVKTLMEVYRKETHDFRSKPIAMGGGTYAKEANNCVGFGSAFKGHEGDIHMANEYIYIKDLYKQIHIYAHAVDALGRLS